MFMRVSVAILGLIASSIAIGHPFNLDREHIPGELIVKFKPGVRSQAASKLGALGGVVKYQFKSSDAQVVRFSQGMSKVSLETIAKRLASDPAVEYVEANTILRANKTPNDKDFDKQYGMQNIKALAAWDVTTGSKNVLVGVIDTGIDYTHPDIAPNYWTNPGETGVDANGKDKATNGVDDDGNGYIDDVRGWDFVNNDNDPMDDHAHGTHCAGVIGAKGNDGAGVAGVNWDVNLVGIKFLSASGSGSLENAVKSIEYATSIGTSLTSNSWGGGGYSPTMVQAIHAANAKGQLFVAAAGNESNNNDNSPSYPASYRVDNVISVAASNNVDEMARFSNFGIESVHVAAPGVDIYSSVPGGQFENMSGTSMATPHVAGVAALVWAAFPTANAAQIKARILGSVDHTDYWKTRVLSGGRVNAFRSLEVDSVPPAAVADLAVVAVDTMSVDVQWGVVGDDDMVGSAAGYEVRTSASPILTEADWNQATRVPSVLRAASQANTLVTTLKFNEFNQGGYVAVRAYDNVGNISKVGKSTAYATKKMNRFYDRAATSLDGFEVQAPWGIESLSDGTAVFSDSPGEVYGNSVDLSMTSPVINVPSKETMLVLDINYEFESGFDFLIVEASKDGGVTWVQADQITGASQGFVRRIVGLQKLDLGDNVRFRLRVKSDNTIGKQGALIRNISMLSPN